jgi:uncharacterized repeat protein (TIGR03803 family)
MGAARTSMGRAWQRWRGCSSRCRAAIAKALLVGLTVIGASAPSQAQTFTVIHDFTGEGDGAGPTAGVTVDTAGNLYGTTQNGGTDGFGIVYRLKHLGSGWQLTPLYSFQGGSDGAVPNASVEFGPDGSLYGTTYEGGGTNCNHTGCGTAFNLKPPLTVCKTALCPWNETVLYRFSGGNDGANPDAGDLIFDEEGNIYGTTLSGGSYPCEGPGCGTVFQLTHSSGGWTKSTIYDFTGGNDGGNPASGVVLDGVGNLYGTTLGGGAYGAGAAFQLMNTGNGWTENTLQSFEVEGSNGYTPAAGVIVDQSNNLFGATSSGGVGNGGTVFELSQSGGRWSLSLLYSLSGGSSGPQGSLVMDSAGNIYGTTLGNGEYGYGNVFKLAPSNGGWTYTSLHDFTGGRDGRHPYSAVALDASGNLYGTTYGGGSGGYGVVYEIVP